MTTPNGTSLWPELWQALGQTLQMAIAALAIGGFCGLLLGLALYVTRRGNILQNRPVFAILNVAVNIVRPIPFIIFITAVRPLTQALTGASYGVEAAIPALAIMATFATSRISSSAPRGMAFPSRCRIPRRRMRMVGMLASPSCESAAGSDASAT